LEAGEDDKKKKKRKKAEEDDDGGSLFLPGLEAEEDDDGRASWTKGLPSYDELIRGARSQKGRKPWADERPSGSIQASPRPQWQPPQVKREQGVDPRDLEKRYAAESSLRKRGFVAIFPLEVLAPYTELYRKIWNDIAANYNFRSVTEGEVSRAMASGVNIINEEFAWSKDPEVAHEIMREFEERLESVALEPDGLDNFPGAAPGAREWIRNFTMGYGGESPPVDLVIVGYDKSNVLRKLANAAGFRDFTIVSVKDYKHTFKPLQQTFLSACTTLRLPPSACCVISTSTTAAKEARGARMTSISIGGLFGGGELSRVSDMSFQSLDQLTSRKVERAILTRREGREDPDASEWGDVQSIWEKRERAQSRSLEFKQRDGSANMVREDVKQKKLGGVSAGARMDDAPEDDRESRIFSPPRGSDLLDRIAEERRAAYPSLPPDGDGGRGGKSGGRLGRSVRQLFGRNKRSSSDGDRPPGVYADRPPGVGGRSRSGGARPKSSRSAPFDLDDF
jgi:beta-phosphoglucomutase-like phosphatase (HAD superfamily)